MNKDIVLMSGNYYGQVKGGTEYQQFLIGSHLKKLGYKMFYLFIDNGDPVEYENYFELLKIRKRVFLRKILGKYFFIDAFKVYRLLKKVRPDVILIRSGFAYVGIAAKYSIGHECKMIWQVAAEKDVNPFEFEYRRSIIFDYIDKKFLAFGIKKADYIIGQAEYQYDLIYRNYGRRCDFIIPNFHPIPQEKIEKYMPVKIVWIANFKELKQPEVFIKLADDFRNFNNLKFIMIGRPDASRWGKRIIAELNKRENIDYMGELSLNKVNDILRISHIFVNTSRYEGFPNTFIQAWMRIVPVVSLNVDPDDIIKKNSIGFHSKNFEQMEKDIALLISNKKLREEMGKRAQKYSFEKFSMKNIKRIVEIIQAK